MKIPRTRKQAEEKALEFCLKQPIENLIDLVLIGTVIQLISFYELLVKFPRIADEIFGKEFNQNTIIARMNDPYTKEKVYKFLKRVREST